jgi:hypothetical protein
LHTSNTFWGNTMLEMTFPAHQNVLKSHSVMANRFFALFYMQLSCHHHQQKELYNPVLLVSSTN